MSLMLRPGIVLAGLLAAALMVVGTGCGHSSANLNPPVVSIAKDATTSDSIMLRIANSNGDKVKTRCDISPSRSRSGAGWHAIGGVPDVPANGTAEFKVDYLRDNSEYQFQCQFHKPGLPRGRISPYSDSLSGSTE